MKEKERKVNGYRYLGSGDLLPLLVAAAILSEADRMMDTVLYGDHKIKMLVSI